MNKSKMILGAIACLIASISWGAMFPVADHALEYIDPFYFSTIRYGAVSIALIILFIRSLYNSIKKESSHQIGKLNKSMDCSLK